MSVTPILKIACDLCGEFHHKSAVSGAPPPLPDNWLETKNRGIRGPDYCLDSVEIICETCHEKLAKLKDELRDRAESADASAADDTDGKHTAMARVDGREIYFLAGRWVFEDSDEVVYVGGRYQSREGRVIPNPTLSVSVDGCDIYFEDGYWWYGGLEERVDSTTVANMAYLDRLADSWVVTASTKGKADDADADDDTAVEKSTKGQPE